MYSEICNIPSICGSFRIVVTPKVVCELVPEAVVSGGAVFPCHGDGSSIGIGVGIGIATPVKGPGDQGCGVSSVPQGGVIS